MVVSALHRLEMQMGRRHSRQRRSAPLWLRTLGNSVTDGVCYCWLIECADREETLFPPDAGA